ncbi:coadhesin-like [Mya arenaria]|uniref:coadhesin-like n=1 Tax=Mya arenaria TaxID=6604 RepID=UPI0022DEA826|nr:coadhesin-like [Mya arenaria]
MAYVGIDCLAVIVALSLSVIEVEGLNCMNCKNVTDPTSCRESASCLGTTQACFTSSKAGLSGTRYDMGCVDKIQCIPSGLVGRRGLTGCFQCCSDDECNLNLCTGVTTTSCRDDETFDCARVNSLFDVCKDIHHAKIVCRAFCGLCDLVDGQWSGWSGWSGCDVTCGQGNNSRSRTCSEPPPAHGGINCSGDGVEARPCSREPCPVAGGWTKWGSWGSCSASCGVGLSRRDRMCTNPRPQLLGDHCFGDNHDDKICWLRSCNASSWSEWSKWSMCSVTCGGGQVTRSRYCITPTPAPYAAACSGNDRDWRMCNNNLCSGLNVMLNVSGPAYIPPCHKEHYSNRTYERVDFSNCNMTFTRNTAVSNNTVDHFDYTTGNFKCPQTGLYFIKLHLSQRSIGTKHNYSLTVSLRCGLCVNGKGVRGFYPWETDDREIGETMTWLNGGDEVGVAHCAGSYPNATLPDVPLDLGLENTSYFSVVLIA